MIEYKTGDILDAKVDALVNTVNCVGIMGRGIALQFKNAFPENYKVYKAACARGDVQPGRMFVYETRTLHNPKFIINFPTKRDWRGKSRIEDIEAGLKALAGEIHKRGIRSIAIPPLGSGLGGLHWHDVRFRIQTALGDLEDVSVIVFEPTDFSESHKNMRTHKVPHMTPGRAALIGLMRRYLGGLMDPFVTLLEIHKLLYFMQEAGEHLRLRYVHAPYGPYAENLRHVLREIEGYYVTGYANGGESPDKELAIVPGADHDADEFLAQHPETRERFERVSKLVQGFESPLGLELLATVHWLATRGNARSIEEIIGCIYDWSERKKQFSPRQIRRTLEVLIERKWLPESFRAA